MTAANPARKVKSVCTLQGQKFVRMPRQNRKKKKSRFVSGKVTSEVKNPRKKKYKKNSRFASTMTRQSLVIVSEAESRLAILLSKPC